MSGAVPVEEIGRKHTPKKKLEELIANESFDLTDGPLELSPKKKNRRAADEFSSPVNEAIELVTEEAELHNSGGRRRRLRSSKATKKALAAPVPKVPKAKAAPKAKRLTYKQALQLAKAPIPQFPQVPDVPPAPAAKEIPPPAASPPSSPYTVDLTGDIKLGKHHSSAPLFQKQVQEPDGSDDDLSDLEFDPDVIKVKVKRKDAIRWYPHRLKQRYYDLYKAISMEDNIPLNQIFLYDGDKRIDPDDTPHTTGFRISTILTCRIMEVKVGDEAVKVSRKNLIELKFQSDKWKKPIAIKVSKFDDFQAAIVVLCQQVPFQPEQVSLRFDGDAVALQQTPMDLEFEGGEILDCGIKV